GRDNGEVRAERKERPFAHGVPLKAAQPILHPFVFRVRERGGGSRACGVVCPEKCRLNPPPRARRGCGCRRRRGGPPASPESNWPRWAAIPPPPHGRAPSARPRDRAKTRARP